jgi:predicted Fe-Mo cluster-binding NifX family protein
MKIVVTAEGNDLSAPTNPRFGRCPTFIFVETDTMAFEAVPNPALSASGGAGIQAAQFVVERGAGAVLTGNLGPNAADVFGAADVPVYFNSESTVRAAVEAFTTGRLPLARGANVPAHAGMGMGRRRAAFPVAPPAGPPAGPPAASREEEIAALKSAAGDLRRQLAEVMERIEKLDKES